MVGLRIGRAPERHHAVADELRHRRRPRPRRSALSRVKCRVTNSVTASGVLRSARVVKPAMSVIITVTSRRLRPAGLEVAAFEQLAADLPGCVDAEPARGAEIVHDLSQQDGQRQQAQQRHHDRQPEIAQTKISDRGGVGAASARVAATPRHTVPKQLASVKAKPRGARAATRAHSGNARRVSSWSRLAKAVAAISTPLRSTPSALLESRREGVARLRDGQLLVARRTRPGRAGRAVGGERLARGSGGRPRTATGRCPAGRRS